MPEPVTAVVFGAVSATANGLTLTHFGKEVLKGVPTGTVFKTENAILKDMAKRLANVRKLLSECTLSLNYGIDSISESPSSQPSPVPAVVDGSDEEEEKTFRTLYREYYDEITGQNLRSAQSIKRPSGGWRVVIQFFTKISHEIKDLQRAIKAVEATAGVVSEAAIARRERERLESDVQMSRDMQAELIALRSDLKCLSPTEQRSKVMAIAMKYGVTEDQARVFANKHCNRKLQDGPNCPTPPTRPAVSRDPPPSTGSRTTSASTATLVGAINAQEIELASLAEQSATRPAGGNNPNPFADPVKSRQSNTTGRS
ncbi:hypothetical protein PQX77_004514 [Marasmius sp. AFHP31]|nr:hypothetical protein PQX77_004514 [Marasmius sp. AFHP31]